MDSEEELSDLYLACKAGDLEEVKQICSRSNLKFRSLNRVESNGDTALHLASSLGHGDIVRFLLQDIGVLQHRLNNDGSTAYQVAKNDQVRQLFHRPLSDRLARLSQSVQNAHDIQILQSTDTEKRNETCAEYRSRTSSVHGDHAEYNDYASRYTSSGAALGLEGYQSFMIKYLPRRRSRQLVMYWGNKLNSWNGEPPSDHSTDAILREEFQTVIDQLIQPTHAQYNKTCALLEEYFTTQRIDPLIRLYTTSTPFYSHTAEEKNPLQFVLLCHLKSLKERYFQGTVYRGVSAEREYLRMYQCASGDRSSVIINVSFWSTSLDHRVASMFHNDQVNLAQVNILLIVHFPQPSEMAIRLSAIPASHSPCLSEFEDEEEVLILPNAMFRVLDIDITESSSCLYTIHMEHIPLQPFSRRRLAKLGSREVFKLARERFRD